MKFTTLAMLGAVNASNKRVEQVKVMCGFSDMMKNFEETCPVQDETQNYTHREFIRKAHYSVWNSFIAGFYHEHHDNVVSEECFGEWMEPMMTRAHNIHHKLHKGDIWGISHAEIKDTANDFIDGFFRNLDSCGAYRFIYNNHEWCINNMEACLSRGEYNMLDRVNAHAFEYMGNGMTLFNAITADDTCYTDQQILDEMETTVKAFADGYSTLIGFQGKWDETASFEKLSFHEMKEEFHEARKDYPKGKCPFKQMFKDALKPLFPTPKDGGCPFKAMMDTFFPSPFQPLGMQQEKTAQFEFPMFSPWGQQQTQEQPVFEMPTFANFKLF